MARIFQCTMIILLLAVNSAGTATVDLVNIPGNGETVDGICPAQESREAGIHNIRASVETAIQVVSNCGPGLWDRVALLNMSTSSHQCPSSWREYNSGGVRGCRRPRSSLGSCPATFYATSRRYSRVCGRVIGYQIGGTNAFGWEAVRTIDSYYVYGVSVTHGSPRNHIWTLAAGITEGGYSIQSHNCPCSNLSHPGNRFPPSFVGNNYHCESGNPAVSYSDRQLYSADPLWDGQECEGQCCSNGKSPPWFSVDLPNPTTDDIEVRICMSRGSIEDVVIQLLELYVH